MGGDYCVGQHGEEQLCDAHTRKAESDSDREPGGDGCLPRDAP